MNNVVIVSAARTAVGKFGGSLKDFNPGQLGSVVLKDAYVVLAGGMESMSQAPYALKSNRWGAKMGNGEVVDLMIHDGLWDIFNNYHMGVTAENVAEKYKITRQEQD